MWSVFTRLQEYNICFTTVKRPTDGSMPALPTAASGGHSSSLAPLPTVIQGLVHKRREVKAQMKSCRCVPHCIEVYCTAAQAGCCRL